MKNKTSTRLLASAFIAAIFILFGFEAFAQNFQNNGSGAYNATCAAVLKIKNASGAFTGTNQLGTTAANYIQGTVAYTSSTSGQIVQGLYYQNLLLENNTKTIQDGVHILGTVACTPTGYSTSFAGYYIVASTGDRTYNGTFYYDGTGAQTIFGESGSGGTNGYNNLNLDNGIKTVAAGTEVEVDEVLTTAADAPLSILGDLVLGSGPTSTLDGTVTINNSGASLTTGSGAVNFNDDVTVTLGDFVMPSGSGTVTIGAGSDFTLANDANAKLSLADGTNLIITGTFSNGYTTDYSNAVFACNSTVTYNGTQNPQLIEGTSSAGYGNLVLSSGAKKGKNHINICKNFSLTGGNLTMHDGSSDYLFTMLDADGTVTYGGGTGNEEVIGRFKRVVESGFGSGTYVLNNKFTTVNITSGTYPGYIQFLVRPSVNPAQYDANKDVNRKITWETDASANFVSTIKVGYLYSEGPSGGTWPSPYTQDKIRFYESNAGGLEKTGTGFTPVRVAASGSNLGSVELAGINWTATTTLPNNIDKIASTNDILLRTGPTTFYTVNSGRWTNPNTWDEGTWPSEDDDAEIRHLVYAGIAGPFAGTGASGNTTPESDVSRYGTTGAAANNVTIAAGYANASLIVGNEDNPDNYVFHFKTGTGNGLFKNLNTNAPTDAFPNNGVKANITATGANGLWITTIVTGSKITTMGVSGIENSGTINNESIIEIGQ
jgi:hypothetical protein